MVWEGYSQYSQKVSDTYILISETVGIYQYADSVMIVPEQGTQIFFTSKKCCVRRLLKRVHDVDG